MLAACQDLRIDSHQYVSMWYSMIAYMRMCEPDFRPFQDSRSGLHTEALFFIGPKNETDFQGIIQEYAFIQWDGFEGRKWYYQVQQV